MRKLLAALAVAVVAMSGAATAAPVWATPSVEYNNYAACLDRNGIGVSGDPDHDIAALNMWELGTAAAWDLKHGIDPHPYIAQGLTERGYSLSSVEPIINCARTTLWDAVKGPGDPGDPAGPVVP